MPSELSWIDYDSEQRDRVRRILSMVNERETRDELGLGGIRDSIADQLFPGTSTIQTRLRYFFFIPWMYRDLELQQIPSRRMAKVAREYEMQLMDALMANDEKDGVFGREAGHALKRLASSVYWAGLGSWGLRRFTGSQEDYFASVDGLHRRRRHERRRDDGEREHDPTTETWHPDLPPPPNGFPDEATLSLAPAEAELVQESIAARHRDSLLALLAENAFEPIPDVEQIWLHPSLADFTPAHRLLITQGRLFSHVMHGAALLYNLLLTRKAGKDSLAEIHAASLSQWSDELDPAEIRSWQLDGLWRCTVDNGHSITRRTIGFVEGWLDRVVATGTALDGDEPAARLIEKRELALKGGRARFVNRRALDQYSGRAGLGRLGYRWSGTRALLLDLHDGLRDGLHDGLRSDS